MTSAIARLATAVAHCPHGGAPAPIRLAASGPPVLALGGHFKNALCVTRADEAFLSQPAGDLDNRAGRRGFDSAVEHLLRVIEVDPEIVVHDLHPDFYSTSVALAFAKRRGLPALGVQHHHAHIAAVAAEHGLRAPLLGLALDGVGLGNDGGIWGGELLRVARGTAIRIGHLRELRLPGADRAAREPWRMAVSALFAMGLSSEIERRYSNRGAALAQMLKRDVNTPAASSMGRWFDAAAGLLRVIDVSSFEGQAAVLLEGLADRHGPVAPLEGGYRLGADNILDLLPLLEHLARQDDAGRGAALFHSTLAAALAAWVCAARDRTGLQIVALGGGCFMNRNLALNLRRHLEAAAMVVLEARQVAPSDAGLALGQAAVALERASS